MNLYTITENNGDTTRTICSKTCIKRAIIDAKMASEKPYYDSDFVDQDGNNIVLNHDYLEHYFLSSNQLVFCDSKSKEPLVTIDVVRTEFIEQWGGIFPLFTQEQGEKPHPFQINGQDCTGFSVGRKWEFYVKTDTGTNQICLSHQDLLDAYEHKGDWHARWVHPVTGKLLNFIFTFSRQSAESSDPLLYGSNEIELARLISEINANVEFSEQEWSDICSSMDLDKESISDTFDLAEDIFEKAKDMLPH